MKRESRIMVFELIKCPEGGEYVAYVIFRGALSVEHVGLINGGQDELERFLVESSLGKEVRLKTRFSGLAGIAAQGLLDYADFVKRFFDEVYKLLC